MTVPKTYRQWIHDKDLVSFTVILKESDLYIRAAANLQQKALRILRKYRNPLEKYIEQNPVFQTSLEPVAVSENAPRIVRMMAEASSKVGVGPMAAVSGTIAELVGTELLEFSPEVIIENGGDIFIKCTRIRTVAVFAGDSPFTGKIGLEIAPADTPLGVCTSSGTVGHSLSFGKADAVITLSQSTPLAKASATAIGNLILTADDIPKGIAFAQSIEGLNGLVIIIGDKMGMWGEVKIKEL